MMAIPGILQPLFDRLRARVGPPERRRGAEPWSLLELLGEDLRFTVVDIGAALTETPTYQPLVARGCARIVAFEPDAEKCARLNAAYGEPHRVWPMFLGEGGDAVFHQTNWVLTGSLLEPNQALNERFQHPANLMTLVARHPVRTTRLDDVPDIDDVDFIKIDVQGAELSVFRGAPRLLSRALAIQTEVEFVPMYKDQPLFGDVDAHLRAAGFQFHMFMGYGSRAFKPLMRIGEPTAGFNQLLWADALYVRDWMRLAEVETAKLKKYAVLMHDLVRSLDLCHLILEEVDRRDGGDLAARYRQRLFGERRD